MALTHRSASVILPNGRRVNNERLEFLGDAILDAVLSEQIFLTLTGFDEGDLTKTRAKIVNRETLNKLAVEMGLNTLLKTQVTNGNGSSNLYGNALEAIIGAVFLDRGYSRTRRFITLKILDHFDLRELTESTTDYKSILFEWAQKNKVSIEFEHSARSNTSDSRQLFSATLLLNNVPSSSGSGITKKEAEQQASSNYLFKLKGIRD